jgi:hypothetical protein
VLVWVASYPRSGNTLTMLVIRNVFGIGRIGTALQPDLDLGRLGRALPSQADGAWTPPVELTRLPKDELVEAIRASDETFFIKTHRLAEARDLAPAIYIVRDGRDSLVSQAHFVAEQGRFADIPFEQRLTRLIDDGTPTRGNWSENVKTWRARSAPTALVRFEDLVRDPPTTVAGAFAELGLPAPIAEGRLPTFDEARAEMPRVFRRGEVGSWPDEMTPELERRFWTRHGETMVSLGYAR